MLAVRPPHLDMSSSVLQRSSSSSHLAPPPSTAASATATSTASDFIPSVSERTRLARDTPTSASMNGDGSMLANGHTGTGNGIGEASGSGSGSAPRREPTSSVNMDADANGSSESIQDPTKNGEKKRKKKGWKGWALVIEDEQGNIIEVNDGPKPEPLPPKRARTRPPGPITTNSSDINARSPSLLTDGHMGKPTSSTSRSESVCDMHQK